MKEFSGGRGRVQPPVGLSSHTATAINDNLICVLGREGGIKTQRRFGDLFLLHLQLGNYFQLVNNFATNYTRAFCKPLRFNIMHCIAYGL